MDLPAETFIPKTTFIYEKKTANFTHTHNTFIH